MLAMQHFTAASIQRIVLCTERRIFLSKDKKSILLMRMDQEEVEDNENFPYYIFLYKIYKLLIYNYKRFL